MERFEAMGLGEKFYSNGKACRRGHTGDRYTSNGMCVACSDVHEQRRAATRHKARTLANTKKFEPARVFSAIVQPGMHTYLADVCDILNFGSEAQTLMLVEAVQAIRQGVKVGRAVRSQGELDSDALRAAVDLSPDVIAYTDGRALEQGVDPDGALLIKVGEYWYLAEAMRLVWTGHRDIIRPGRYAGPMVQL